MRHLMCRLGSDPKRHICKQCVAFAPDLQSTGLGRCAIWGQTPNRTPRRAGGRSPRPQALADGVHCALVSINPHLPGRAGRQLMAAAARHWHPTSTSPTTPSLGTTRSCMCHLGSDPQMTHRGLASQLLNSFGYEWRIKRMGRGIAMPRKPRRLLDNGYYHIVLKGSGNQILFESEGDYRKFLSYLYEFAARHKLQLIAWCPHEQSRSSSGARHCPGALVMHSRSRNGLCRAPPIDAMDIRAPCLMAGSIACSSSPMSSSCPPSAMCTTIRKGHRSARRRITPWSSYSEYLHPGVVSSQDGCSL